jgi:hypothetical protein
MNGAAQRIRAISQETARLTRREKEASLQRLARAGSVMEASQSMIDRTKELLAVTARIVHNRNLGKSAALPHSTNSNSSA